jgi:ribose transport system substrate-binding protein
LPNDARGKLDFTFKLTHRRQLSGSSMSRINYRRFSSISSTVCLPLFFLFLVACSRQPPTIAFIPQDTADDIWEPAHTAAAIVAKEKGFKVHWNGPTNSDDFQRQIVLLDRAIGRGDKGIIIAPDQSLALMTPLRHALSEGLPTVVVGSPLPLPAGGELYYVLNDEEEGGRIAAARLCERLGGKGSLAILGVRPDSPGLVLRLHAFESALALGCPGITIVAVRMSSGGEAQAENVAESVLESEPQLDAILAVSGIATMGASRALVVRHRDRQVLLVGYDQQLDQLYYLTQGLIDSLLVENTFAMGDLAIKMIMAHRSGQETAHTTLVKPILITRDNVYEPSLERILPHWRSAQ